MPGDDILIGTSTQRRVVSIATDAITVDSTLTCSNGDPVYYGTTNSVDIGFAPYKAGGYTLTGTKALAAGTWTITPNDASLVRFVVCYNAGVPYAVDNTSPYTCSAPSGSFSAYLYPRYASTTQRVPAS